jgi:hypothetical protein
MSLRGESLFQLVQVRWVPLFRIVVLMLFLSRTH